MSPVARYVESPFQPRVLVEDFGPDVAKEYGLPRVPIVLTPVRLIMALLFPFPLPLPLLLPSFRLTAQCPSCPFCAG